MGIGKIIKDVRKEKKYTLSQLRDITGISESYLSEISNDKQDLPLRTLNKIAKALDVNPSYLMERTELEYGSHKDVVKYSIQELLSILKDFNNWPEKDRREIVEFVIKVKEIKESRK